VKIEDQFRVDVGVAEAWAVLLDVERIAPCLPGAQLQEIEGDEYRGIVKVKVGPITAQYKGAARIVEADEGARRVVLEAEGRDTRGQGNASATVTATLTESGSGTLVTIDTDLKVTGKVAQFGRGVMADVSSKLLGQFAQNLERDVLGGSGAPAPAPAPIAAAVDGVVNGDGPTGNGPSGNGEAAEPSAIRWVSSPDPEPVDLLDTAGGAVARRVIPVVATLGLLVVLRAWRRRRAEVRARRG
jgi:carbon monoxide dehydrogenase subunit G